MISLFASALLVIGQPAADELRKPECAWIYFLGFRASRAAIVSGETRWDGWLSDYDPSTDISASLRLCPMASRVTISTVSGDVTVVIPPDMDEAHIVVDARDVASSSASSRPPLLD
jgi:hypothetical protein